MNQEVVYHNMERLEKGIFKDTDSGTRENEELFEEYFLRQWYLLQIINLLH